MMPIFSSLLSSLCTVSCMAKGTGRALQKVPGSLLRNFIVALMPLITGRNPGLWATWLIETWDWRERPARAS